MVDSTYLTGVHKIDKPLNLHTNAGTRLTKHKGYLGSQLFWIDKMEIANVISLCSLEKKYHVAHDSHRDGRGAFVANTPDGDTVFRRCPETGFPYLDLDNHSNDGVVLLV